MTLASSIGWILVFSGIVTAAGGLTALLLAVQLLRLAFGVGDGGASTVFFVRHWGVLIFAVGGLILCAAYVPSVRAPVLTAAALEKFAIGILVFFGPLKRTTAMTVIAAIDGLFAASYVAYLAGL
jgi:hypothetical protein